VSYAKLGDLDGWVDPAKARDWYEQGLEIARRLAALEPENTDYQRALSLSYERLGDLDGRVDPAKARDWYAQGLEIARRLAALEPENVQAACDLAISLNKLAEWHLGEDETGLAEDYSKQAIALMEQAASLSPEDSGLQYNLACARARLGRIEGALEALDRSVDLGYTNADWARQDPDLRSLRGLAEFDAILARMRGAP
jgi:tetratricopeptide (TPR) repeat protein